MNGLHRAFNRSHRLVGGNGFRNQCAHWWRKHFHKSAGRPENPQIFRPAQSFFYALKDAAADFNALDEKTPQRIFYACFAYSRIAFITFLRPLAEGSFSIASIRLPRSL